MQRVDARGAALWDLSPRSELLVVRGLVKRYGGNVAVDDVSFAVEPGRVVGLVGPNGAGKSTVGNLIAGSVTCDRGEVWLAGHRIDKLPAWKRGRLGLSRTFQRSSEFRGLTVLENLLSGSRVGAYSRLRWSYVGRPRWKRIESDEIDRARQLLTEFDLEPYENEYAERLSGGQRRLVEIGRALMGQPKLLILDEPMAGLNARMIDKVALHVARLKGDALGMLLIEHNVDVVSALADRIIAMGQGRILAMGTPEEVISNEVVMNVYLRG